MHIVLRLAGGGSQPSGDPVACRQPFSEWVTLEKHSNPYYHLLTPDVRIVLAPQEFELRLSKKAGAPPETWTENPRVDLLPLDCSSLGFFFADQVALREHSIRRTAYSCSSLTRLP